MGLRNQVLADGQTLEDMAAAWERRYEDACALGAAGCHTGRVYLLGYVAEMLIKVSLFRLLGIPGSVPWRATAKGAPSLSTCVDSEQNSLAAMGQKVDRQKVGWDGGHSLSFFACVLVRARRRRGLTDPRWERQLLRAVSDVQREWCVEMRYWPGDAGAVIADDVERAVWLLLDRLA